MQVQTEPDSPPEPFADFGSIATLRTTALHPPFLVHNPSLNDTIPDGFANDILCVFFGVEVQFHADIAKRYAGIRKREATNTGLDDILPETDDESVSLVTFELRGVSGEGRLKFGEGSCSDG